MSQMQLPVSLGIIKAEMTCMLSPFFTWSCHPTHSEPWTGWRSILHRCPEGSPLGYKHLHSLLTPLWQFSLFSMSEKSFSVGLPMHQKFHSQINHVSVPWPVRNVGLFNWLRSSEMSHGLRQCFETI